jgi:hypothetical protein
MAVYKLLVEKKKKIPRDILLSLLELAAYNAEVIQIFFIHCHCSGPGYVIFIAWIRIRVQDSSYGSGFKDP